MWYFLVLTSITIEFTIFNIKLWKIEHSEIRLHEIDFKGNSPDAKSNEIWQFGFNLLLNLHKKFL